MTIIRQTYIKTKKSIQLMSNGFIRISRDWIHSLQSSDQNGGYFTSKTFLANDNSWIHFSASLQNGPGRASFSSKILCNLFETL
jgi:hypothetical protein